ncbi:hypothetical protein fugu_019016 [Takifugu bimaculatus]|uniref:Mitochondrial fission process protein 1 n=1 Tax=Takifugu bimaculatus TaxID=433685 RepID=A0A4Z2BI13_9TELE|nr:hypothetical protein fugu_019016 [Takifugu bimaculatus]
MEEKTTKPVDIYRDTWVRFLGYANEVGEAFRALVPAHGDNPGKSGRVAVAVVDTFVWQALASVIIPGFTINRWMTTAIGLSTIPFIITPIDRSVDFLLDASLRKVYQEGEKHK